MHQGPPPSVRSRLAALLALAAAASACAHAAPRQDGWSERVGGRSVEVLLRYEAIDEGVAGQVRRALPVAIPIAERWGELSGTLTITIHPTHAALERAARRPGHPWLRAWARPQGIELQTVRTWTRGGASDAELTQLLAHELTHCAMFQAIGSDLRVGRTIPVWFREGMASSNAGARLPAPGADEPLPGVPAGSADAYRTDWQGVYAASDRAFRALVREHGDAQVRAILALMRGGAEFRDAFRAATGVSLDEFEAELGRAARRAASRG